MAKIMKKNIASPMMPPSCFTDWNNVPISSFMLGIEFKLLSGLKSLKVRSPLMFFMDGS